MNLIKAITFLLCSTLLVGQTTPIRNPQIQGASGSIVLGATLTNSGTFTNSGTLGGAGTFDFSSGTVTMPATQILTNVTLNGTIAFADNIKQTFNPGATYVGINVGSYAGVPSTLANGDIWYDSVADALKARIGNATVSLGAGGGGGGSTTFAALTDVNLTTLASGDFLKWDGTDWINRTASDVRTDLGLGAAALLGTSTGGNGTADNGKVLIFDTGGHFHATTSISVNNTSGTITAQFRPDSLLLNSTGSGSHTINGSATGARTHTFLDESGTLAHTATTLAGYGITDAQPLDTTLTALAALNNTKGVLAQTGSDTFTRLQTPVNVKVYGALGDARKVTDAVLNGTTTVTSATAAFTSADTGKVVWGIETSSGVARLPVGTATYVNSTTITCSVSATGSYTGISLVIGTDDTAEIQAAATAADAMSPKGQVYIPSGGYVFSDRLFNQSYASVAETYSIVGDGSSVTKLFASPSHALTGSVILNTQSSANTGVVRGIQIDGSNYEFAGSPHGAVATGYAVWDDVKIVNFKGLSSILNVQTANGRFYNCHIEGSSYVGILVAGSAEFYGCYTGNHGYIALHLSNASAVWVGGTVDECTGPSIYLGTSTLRITDALVYAGGSQNACETNGSSTIYASSSRFVPFSSNNNCTGISVASGGTARLANCILTGSGTGYGLNNSGTVYDVGGNTFTTTTGTAPVDALSSVVSVAHGGTGATALTNLITLATHTTGNYVADVAGTSNEITSTHTPGEGSTATLSLPATIDLGGKTSFEIPNGAAPTVDAFGEIAGDNDLWAASRGAPVFFDGTAATALVNVLVSDTPSNGQVPVWNTGGTITWETNGSGSVATDTIWDAKGDLAGGTGSNTAARLPVGTNGYVLTADSAETTGMKWAAASGGSGNWVLVSTTTISGTPATIDFDVSTGYRRYRLELDSVICGGDGYVLYMRTSTDGGSTYDSGASDYNSGHGPSATYLPTQVTSAQIETGAIIGADAGEGWSGEIDIYEPGATTNRPFCQWSLFGPHYSSGAYNILTGGARRATAADIDHVRLLFQSANTFLSGKIRLFRWSE